MLERLLKRFELIRQQNIEIDSQKMNLSSFDERSRPQMKPFDAHENEGNENENIDSGAPCDHLNSEW